MAWSRRKRRVYAGLAALLLMLAAGAWWALAEGTFGLDVRGTPLDPAGRRFRLRIATEVVGEWKGEGEAVFRPGQTVYFGTLRRRLAVSDMLGKLLGARGAQAAARLFPSAAASLKAGSMDLEWDRQRTLTWRRPAEPADYQFCMEGDEYHFALCESPRDGRGTVEHFEGLEERALLDKSARTGDFVLRIDFERLGRDQP